MIKKMDRLTRLTALSLLVAAPLVHADESALNLSLPDQGWTPTTSWQLASADTDTSALKVKFKSADDFEEPLFSENKIHQYLGLGTLALVALTAVLPKEEDGPHEIAGTLAATMATATVTSGFISHWEDFDLSQGLTEPDNMHMILGTAGALAMIAAVSQAPEGGHAGLGILGGLTMGIAVKMNW